MANRDTGRTMKTIRVLIADDHTIVRIGLKALLGAEKDIEIVGEAKNGEMAVKEAMRLQPDVVIMDLMMPKMDGAAATAALRDSFVSISHLLPFVNTFF